MAVNDDANAFADLLDKYITDTPPDEVSGAPYVARTAVGAAPTERDRLATIRNFYPDAMPYGSDNFVYTDPRTQRRTVFNPPGLDMGDAFGVLPEAAEMVGGVAGGLLATPSNVAAPGVATFAGYGLGSAAAREAVNQYLTSIGATSDSRSTGQRLLDAGVTAGTAAIGEKLGVLGGQAIEKGLRRPASAAMRYLTPDATARLEQMRALGMNPRPSAVTGSSTLGNIEQAAGQFPGGSGVMQRVVQGEREALQTEQRALASQLGGEVEEASIGPRVLSGFKDYIDETKKTTSQLYDKAYDVIPKNEPINSANISPLIALRADFAERAGKNPDLENTYRPNIDRIDRIVEGIQSGATDIGALLQIRTNIGRDINPVSYNGSGSQIEADKAIYAKLSEIADNYASQFPGGAQRLKRAQKYRRLTGMRIEALENVLNSDAPDKIFNSLMSSARTGGSTLQGLRRSLSKTEQGRVTYDALVGTVINRVGRARPGAQGASGALEQANEFSAATFLTNYSALSGGAKRALFGGSRYAELRPALDRLVSVSSAIKDADKLYNTSNSGRVILSALGLFGGLLPSANTLPDVDLGTTLVSGATVAAGTVLGSAAVARLITNPAFVGWLTKSPQKFTEKSVARWVSRLANVGKVAPEIRDEVDALVFAAEQAE